MQDYVDLFKWIIKFFYELCLVRFVFYCASLSGVDVLFSIFSLPPFEKLIAVSLSLSLSLFTYFILCERLPLLSAKDHCTAGRKFSRFQPN